MKDSENQWFEIGRWTFLSEMGLCQFLGIVGNVYLYRRSISICPDRYWWPDIVNKSKDQHEYEKPCRSGLARLCCQQREVLSLLLLLWILILLRPHVHLFERVSIGIGIVSRDISQSRPYILNGAKSTGDNQWWIIHHHFVGISLRRLASSLQGRSLLVINGV